jgi:hypothetical protein
MRDHPGGTDRSVRRYADLQPSGAGAALRQFQPGFQLGLKGGVATAIINFENEPF